MTRFLQLLALLMAVAGLGISAENAWGSWKTYKAVERSGRNGLYRYTARLTWEVALVRTITMFWVAAMGLFRLHAEPTHISTEMSLLIIGMTLTLVIASVVVVRGRHKIDGMIEETEEGTV